MCFEYLLGNSLSTRMCASTFTSLITGEVHDLVALDSRQRVKLDAHIRGNRRNERYFLLLRKLLEVFSSRLSSKVRYSGTLSAQRDGGWPAASRRQRVFKWDLQRLRTY